MKKIILILSVLSLLVCALPLCACKEKNPYPPVESTADEAREIAVMTYGEETYTLRAELYDALAAQKGGNGDAAEAHDAVFRAVSGIFAAFSVAGENGIDPYGADADAYVSEAIAEAVGDGTYEEYLAALSQLHLNYAAQELLYRYGYALNALEEKFVPAEAEADDTALRAFYDGEECARVLCAYLPAAFKSAEDAEKLREGLARLNDPEFAALYIIGQTLAEGDSLLDSQTQTAVGTLYTAHDVESVYYADLIAAALALRPNEVSEVIRVADSGEDGYYILYGLDKSDAFFTDHASAVRQAYARNELGKRLDARADELLASVVYFAEAYGERG